MRAYRHKIDETQSPSQLQQPCIVLFIRSNQLLQPRSTNLQSAHQNARPCL